MKNQTLASLLFAVVLISGSLASCGDNNAQQTTDTSAVNIDTTQEVTETEDSMLHDNLPGDLDFSGAQISILARGDDDSYLEIDAENDGDVVNDAVYARNLSVEERLNVDLIPIRGEGWQNYSSDLTKLRASVNSGSNAYQIVAGFGQSISSLALENVFCDLTQYDYLDLEQVWWNQSTVESMRICDALYFVTGDIGLITSLGGSYVLFANDVIMNNYDIANLAGMVHNGTWTIDAMLTETAKVYHDLDGNGVMDDMDLYGFVIDHRVYADYFAIGAGIRQITLTEDNIPQYTPQLDKMTTLLDKITPIFGENSASVGAIMLNKGNGGGRHYEMFPEGKAMIISAELSFATTEAYRNAEDGYTILPYPKMDETQERYYVNGSNGASLWGIPTDVTTPEISAAVLEAMACASYNYVTPAYFETCLQTKMARNEDTIAMLNIIRDGCYVDAEYLYKGLFSETCHTAQKILSGKKGAASWYESNQKKIDKSVEKAIQSFKDLQS